MSRAFYTTQPAPCPYLPGRIERRIVTFLDPDDDAVHDALTRAGFRRSQRMAYRPACDGCTACIPVRIPVATFAWSRSFRRIVRRNADLTCVELPARATPDQYRLFRRYLLARHSDGGMADMGWDAYRSMVEDGPSTGFIVEFRGPDRQLMAVCLSDRLASGLSGIYKFFDPEAAARSLGSYIILWHVSRAAELGLAYAYLGYWIADCQKMAYKARFRPIERLTSGGWRPL